ncbi:MAG: helix-turn-helix domain-containing protein [Pusillimonas sp.]
MKVDLHTLEDINLLGESLELECKLAQGQDGTGEVPKDFWRTYSAMANAQGGVVLFGVQEKAGQFSVAGLKNPAKVRADLFNTLNNRAKVSTNLLNDADVTIVVVDSRNVLVISIPAATRKQKPVFLNGQPLGNTWLRLNDGDRHCDDETVKRMLAEHLEDERDARILIGFDMHDLDGESLRIYRQMLRDKKPAHPYLEQNDADFLKSLRGWRRDRQTGEEGLTIAGLLMFGKWDAIQEAMPHYFLDYQERPEAKTGLRWIDRLVPDGTWTGNLFEFYRRVYRKLTSDLKVPFALKGGQRQEDTPVHVALREALVNTLVHADYTGRLSVLVVKRPDMFGFRNPGRLRLPIFPSMDAGIARTTSEHWQPTSEHWQPTSEDVLGSWERDAQGRMLSAHLDAPIVDDLNKLEPTFLSALKDLAQEPAQWSRLERSRMESVILSICQDQFLTLSAMSQLVCRSPDGLRQQYLSRMVKSGSMTLAFPTKPTHEKQAYRAVPGVRPIEANESARRSQ